MVDVVSEQYDLVIIGSSPMSLVEASLRAKSGDRVCIIEARDGLGGAWSVGTCFGIKDIEWSPHIFMSDETSNKVLEVFLPSEYEELELEPRLMIRWSKIFRDFYLIKMVQRYKEAWVLSVINNWENKKKIL